MFFAIKLKKGNSNLEGTKHFKGKKTLTRTKHMINIQFQVALQNNKTILTNRKKPHSYL